MAQKGLSLKPSEAVHGGLLDDFDGVIKEAEFTTFDYQGSQPDIPALRLGFETDEGEEGEQFFSAGSMKECTPSADGEMLVPTGSKVAINDNSNLFVFLKSLVDAGFPEDSIEDKISAIVGLNAHFIRVAQPKRRGLAASSEDGGRERTVLTVSKIISLPGEKAKGKAKGRAATTATEGDDGITEVATNLVMQAIVNEDGGPVTKQQLAKLAFKTIKDAKVKSAVVKMVHDNDFLGSGVWDFAKNAVTGDKDMLEGLL